MERKAHNTPGKARTIVAVGSVRIGHDPFPVIAGPCAIESEEQIMSVAEAAADSGVSILRGGAWKSTSSPYDFRGLGEEAIEMLAAGRPPQRPSHCDPGSGVVSRRDRRRPGRHARDRLRKHAGLRAPAPGGSERQAGAPAPRPLRHPRRVAVGGRVPAGRGQRAGGPRRARHPHLRDTRCRHPRHRGGAVASRNHPPYR
jgi:hypothetical protein